MPPCQLHVLTDKLSQGEREEVEEQERGNETEQGLFCILLWSLGKKMKANMKKMALSFEIKG